MTQFSRRAFFASCRSGVMGPTLDIDEVSGAERILDAMTGAPLSWTAYALATAWHETAHTMQPISEYGGTNYFIRMYDVRGNRPELARRMGNTAIGDGPLYRGRGYVQLTWKSNYKRAQDETGHALVANPDLALKPGIAADIMRKGMEQGWFTTKKFADFLPAGMPASNRQFFSARRIINGTDKASLIAGYAEGFQEALHDGDWG